MFSHTLGILDESFAWAGSQMAKVPEQWCVTLDPAVTAELVDEARRIGRGTNEEISRHAVDRSRLPNAAPALSKIEKEVMTGRGFALLKSPAALDDTMLKAYYWVLMNLMGRPLSQNSHGQLLRDVVDTGKKLGDQRVRGYETNAELKFHTDRCDMVGLLCIRKAMEGGRSSIASSISVYKELAAQKPELIAPLINGVNFMSIEEGGENSVKRVPVFTANQGALSCRYSRNSFATAIRQGVPYTDLEKTALDAVDQLAEDSRFRLDMELERGDIQIINNYTTLHSRTAFKDWPERERRRCMIRIWLQTDTARPVSKDFDDYRGIPATLGSAAH